MENTQKYQPQGSRIDPEGLHDYMKEEIEKLREENKKLKEEKDHFAISMIKNTRQNYDEWKKETESVAIELIRLDLERAEEENKQLKEKLERVTSVRDDFAHTCATLNTALDIVDHNGVVSITKEELDENIESRGEPDNDKLVKILYEFYEVDED
jgi:chromosome segregation ATPase